MSLVLGLLRWTAAWAFCVGLEEGVGLLSFGVSGRRAEGRGDIDLWVCYAVYHLFLELYANVIFVTCLQAFIYSFVKHI